MSNVNPIFSIEYPNLDTLLFIRKQYPQLADMEIGTSIIDEECIVAHYLPAEDKACQVAEELIYFGTLLASTKHFHRTDDQYDLVYRCVSLAHEAEESKTVEAFSSLGEKEKIKVKVELPKFERVSQIEVKCDRNDVLTITYPRDETVFSNVDFEARSTYFDFQRSIADTILDVLKEEFGSVPETRLFIGRNNVSFHIFDFTRFRLGAETTTESVVSEISAFLLKPEHQSVSEAKADKTPETTTGEVLFVNLDNSKPVTLGDLLRSHLANPQQVESPAVEPFEVETFITESKPDEVLGYVGAGYDGELDQLSITYPYDKTVFTTINVNDPEEYFENIKTISDGVRTIFKREYDFEANPRLLGIKDKIKIYVDDLSKVAERVRKVSGPFDPGIEKAILEEVIVNVVPKISTLVLKPQFIANRPD